MSITKTATDPYRFAVRWCALNDEPCETRREWVEAATTTMLVADTFGKTTAQVAAAIIRYRRQNVL